MSQTRIAVYPGTFDTITNGHGQMLGYGYNVTIDDRWRIVMYIRALQRSQNALVDDASPDEQAQLEKTKKPDAPAPAPAAPAAPTKPAGSASNGTNKTDRTYQSYAVAATTTITP